MRAFSEHGVVGRIIAPQRCSQIWTQSRWICYIPWQKRLKVAGGIKAANYYGLSCLSHKSHMLQYQSSVPLNVAEFGNMVFKLVINLREVIMVGPNPIWLVPFKKRRLWGGRWQGSSRGRGHMYAYGWFMLIFGRNHHNTVKQLSFN